MLGGGFLLCGSARRLAVDRLGVNETSSTSTVKRSRRVTCAPSAAFVTYQEYAGLDCGGTPYFNATYDVRKFTSFAAAASRFGFFFEVTGHEIIINSSNRRNVGGVWWCLVCCFCFARLP